MTYKSNSAYEMMCSPASSYSFGGYKRDEVAQAYGLTGKAYKPAQQKPVGGSGIQMINLNRL